MRQSLRCMSVSFQTLNKCQREKHLLSQARAAGHGNRHYHDAGDNSRVQFGVLKTLENMIGVHMSFCKAVAFNSFDVVRQNASIDSLQRVLRMDELTSLMTETQL